MKQFYLLACVSFVSFSILLARTKKPTCELSVTAEWVDLDEKDRNETFGSKWVRVATFTIKNRSKEFIPLEQINLGWKGKPIEELEASLFKKDPYGNNCMALEESLVCDGIWHKDTQILQLKFKERQHLQVVTSFCLVLTVPQKLENTLKSGHFAVLANKLPRQLQPSAEKKEFKISMLAQSSKNRRSHRLTHIV